MNASVLARCVILAYAICCLNDQSYYIDVKRHVANYTHGIVTCHTAVIVMHAADTHHYDITTSSTRHESVTANDVHSLGHLNGAQRQAAHVHVHSLTRHLSIKQSEPKGSLIFANAATAVARF